jgi:hypothetical protein
MKRCWKITKARATDLRTGKVDQDLRAEFEDCVGVSSRNWEKGDQIHCTSKFRLLDDDRIVYVEGICSASVDFEPLDDYGMGGLGCTMIQFYEGPKRGWVTL